MKLYNVNFVDIESGAVFNDSTYTINDEIYSPYIHWFPDNCSTGLIYNMPLCFISKDKEVQVSIEDTPIFFLLNTNKFNNIKDEDINGFTYKDLNNKDIKTNTLTSIGVNYNDLFLHLVYICATSKNEAEFITKLYISPLNHQGFKSAGYNIGFRAYDNNEIGNINLSNFGINIPNSIQKSIYISNVHEDLDDNILLNRKWKELLTNYWDVVANRGSYRSAINSLKWFEWGNLIRLREFWKYNEFPDINKTIYEDREIKSIMTERYKETLCRFSKSTYLGLYFAMQKLTGRYDDQKNPELVDILKNTSIKWSKIDLMLKLSLLGSFYETYFLPVHIDLIHSTIEDIVFTNTFKILNSWITNREDYIYDTQAITCNIKENDKFPISNVNIQVGPDTIFGTQYSGESKYEDIKIVGVDKIIGAIDDPRTFFTQYFNNVGALIPIHIKINAVNDFISHGILCISGSDNKWIQRDTYKIFSPNENGIIDIDFNILCEKVDSYDLRLEFISAGCRVYTYNVKFNVIDISNPILKIYKVKRSYTSKLSENQINDYIMGRYHNYRLPYDETNISPYILQYIPIPMVKNGDGPKLNNILIFKQIGTPIDISNTYKFIRDNYTVGERKITNKDITYTICISNKFWFDPPMDQINSSPLKDMLYRNDYSFIPELHTLEEITGKDFKNYIISDKDVLCVIPFLKTNNIELPFRYGKDLDEDIFEWEFENISTGQIFKLTGSTQEPYISREKRFLEPGYYNIVFRYKLNGEIKQLKMNSAFFKN